MLSRLAVGQAIVFRGLPSSSTALAMHARHARPEDAMHIARIYNQGIADRTATFETRPRTASDIHAWFDGAHPLLVVEEEGAVVAFAATFPYRPRACYAGIAEASVYVDRAFHRHGAGRMALESLIAAAAAAGFWKLVSRIFVENTHQPPDGRRARFSRGGDL
jgi:phosphinothricin acetyltransferase